MERLLRSVINKRKIILILTLFFAVVGILSYYIIPRQETPDVSVPVAMIITPYPGASPTDVNDVVTKKIEEKLVELDGYDFSKGISKESISIVVVRFRSNADNDKAMQEVRNAMADVQPELPDGVGTSTINTDLVETAGMIISLTGKNYSYDQLEAFADEFKDKLLDINGISKAKVVGKLNKEVKVDLNTARLNQFELSLEDICKILAAQNVQIPSGDIDYKDEKISVSIPGTYISVEDIKNTVISVSSATGAVTRLNDIADIYMGIEDNTPKFKEDGNDAVLLTGYFSDNKNVVIIGKDVRKAVDEVKAMLPKDIIVHEVIYQPDAVSSSINEFMFHLLFGVMLVMIVVLIVMGLRNALVISTAIPLSILITFTFMYLLKMQLHQISLTALIIALGILVDDAIVVCDSIQVKLNEGEDQLIAIYNGTKRCMVPIFSATIAIIAAFLPLLGIPGVSGQFMKAIPVVLIISITASYFVAVFVLPAMMAFFAKKEQKIRGKNTIRIRLWFQAMLDLGLQRKRDAVLIVVGLLLIVIIVIMPMLRSQFFPFVDKDFFYIEINSENTNIDSTEKLSDRVESLLQKEPEVINCTSAIGTGMPKFYVTMDPPKPSGDYAQIIVKYDLSKSKIFKNNEEYANHIQALLDQNISAGKCKVKLLEYTSSNNAKITVRILGNSIEQMAKVSDKLQKEMKKIPGISNVRDNWNDSVFQLKVQIDDDKASNLGITKYDIQKEINLALYGYDASVFRKDGNEYNIRVKSDINSVAMLENFKIKSSITSNKIPLSGIANIGYTTKMNAINTYIKDLYIDVLADPLPGYDSSSIENQIEKDILPKIDTSGSKIKFAGEREDVAQNFTALGLLAIASIFAIYVVLFIQFNSFIQPLIILTTIPLSLIGSVLGLFVFRQPLSLTALLGIIALSGVVVKNGILLIDYINDARKTGISIADACRDAVDKRFNAIILSALTVVLALVPLATSGSDLFAPMAVSMMTGLLISTFSTMVIIPVIYCIAEENKGKYNNSKMIAKLKSISLWHFRSN